MLGNKTGFPTNNVLQINMVPWPGSDYIINTVTRWSMSRSLLVTKRDLGRYLYRHDSNIIQHQNNTIHNVFTLKTCRIFYLVYKRYNCWQCQLTLRAARGRPVPGAVPHTRPELLPYEEESSRAGVPHSASLVVLGHQVHEAVRDGGWGGAPGGWKVGSDAWLDI